MVRKSIPMAICYDFDGTLSPGNMQEYGFMNSLGTTPERFWVKSNSFAKEHSADINLAYMKRMIEEAKIKDVPFNKQAFCDYGKSVKLFEGVKEWFTRINRYGKEHGIEVKHYIISSGLKEIIECTDIGTCFECIFASSYIYDANGIPIWPANVVNYTSKTQYIFRINKGCCDINDNKSINSYIKEEERPVPFSNMVFIGDGETDIPAMKMVKVNGGHSIAVYKPTKKDAKTKAKKLIKDNRVNIITQADYQENSMIDKYIKALINKIEADYTLKKLEKKDN